MEPRGPECTRRGGARRPRPSVHSWPSRWAFDDRWRVELTNSPSTAKNLLAIPVARVRAALTRGQDRRRCGPDRPSTTPTGKPSSRTPRPGRFPLPKRPRSAVVWRSSSGEGRTPARQRARPGTRGRARNDASPAPRTSTGTSRAGLLDEEANRAAPPRT